MATFTYTYPAYNSEPDILNYASNLNYMLSTDARGFALNSLVHVDGANHPSRSGANLYEFYATASKACLAGAQTLMAPWTMVSNPAGDPVVGVPSDYISASTSGVWLIGINVASSVNQPEGASWNGFISGTRVGYPQAGDGGFYGTRVVVANGPWAFDLYVVTPNAATITAKVYGIRVAS